jgi:hypothetical protein
LLLERGIQGLHDGGHQGETRCPRQRPPQTPIRASRPRRRTLKWRPWGWIAVAGLLAASVFVLGIYALNLNSDLDDADADAQIASQQGQIDQAQETGVDIVASAQAAYDDLSAHFGAARDDASQAADEAAEAQDQPKQAAAEPQAPPTRSRRGPTRLRQRPRAPPPARNRSCRRAAWSSAARRSKRPSTRPSRSCRRSSRSARPRWARGPGVPSLLTLPVDVDLRAGVARTDSA